jgi:hypothetical protein
MEELDVPNPLAARKLNDGSATQESEPSFKDERESVWKDEDTNAVVCPGADGWALTRFSAKFLAPKPVAPAMLFVVLVNLVGTIVLMTASGYVSGDLLGALSMLCQAIT